MIKGFGIILAGSPFSMQQRTHQLLADLEAAEWFSAVGFDVPEHFQTQVIVVSSWHEAVESCGSLSWENFTLEQQNLLTSYLHEHAHDRYQQWNTIVDEAKSAMEGIVDRKIRPVVEEHDLPAIVGHCVRWDVLGAYMESEFADLRRSGFFTDLIDWYKRGRFPCGWGKVDPDG